MSEFLFWNPEEVPSDLAEALRALAEEYPLREGEGAPTVSFAPSLEEGRCRATRTGDVFHVEHARINDALRGVGAALAGLPGDGETVDERSPFTALGIMLDCSRNAVMKVEHVKRWLRRLALLGYTMVMLYTEDTYRLPDEPFFGLFRGAYTADELKEMDEYAGRLGIEMIGCIQTLGHLEQILRWGAYGKVRDTERELLVGEPATYELIRKMIAHFAENLRSRRIHIGMDETWTLGRGRFLDLHGQTPGFEILSRHLSEVTGICEGHGLKPMMWSDMFFKFGGRMDTDYDADSVIPAEVRDAMPSDLDLVYWDYSGDTEQHYARLIERHRALGREPIVASGVWTWLRVWYGRSETEAFVPPCIAACRNAGVKELFFTMWADDGGYCEFDSSLAGLAYAAAAVYDEPEEAMKRRYRAICGIGYDETMLGAELEYRSPDVRNMWSADAMAAAALWDDPLLGMHFLGAAARHPGHWERAAEHYRGLAERLEPYREVTEPVDLGHARAMAILLAEKIAFRLRLERAYQDRDRAELGELVETAAGLVELTDQLMTTFRRQWLRRNKPLGLEVIEARLGAVRARFAEAGRRLQELLDGQTDAIPELDEGLALSDEERKALHVSGRWARLVSGSVIV